MTSDLRIIRRLDIESRFGMGRPLLYKEIARGTFPKGIKLTSSTGKSGAVGWIESEVIQYFQDRVAESRAGLTVGAAMPQNASIVPDRG